MFVPNSGSKNEFAKFVGAVTTSRGKASRPSNVTVFGYPEWITFRGESFDELCDLDATIYSRFLSNDSRRDIRELKDRYKALYGEEMFEAVPTQGILGYDTGAFIIKACAESRIRAHSRRNMTVCSPISNSAGAVKRRPTLFPGT